MSKQTFEVKVFEKIKLPFPWSTLTISVRK